MKKRITAITTAILLAGTMLAGCAQSSDALQSSAKADSASGSSAATEASSAASTTSDASEAGSTSASTEAASDGQIVAADTSTDYGSLKLTMGSTGAAEDISTQAMTYMKDYIEQKSGGAITVDTYPASQLGDAVSQLEMTGQGSIDLFLEANYMSSNGVNDAKVGSLTFTCGSKEQYRKLNESDLHKDWENQFCDKTGVKIIADNWYRNGTALVSNKEIHTVADMQGLKVRVPQVDITLDCFKKVGMNPTPIAYNESLLSLQQGIVDAIWCTEDAAYTMGFYTVAKYLVELNCYYDSMFVYMNNDLYSSGVTDAQRDLIVEAANKAGEYYSGLADDALTTNVQKMKDAGIEVITLDPEEVKKLQAPMQEIADEYEANGEWDKGTYAKVQEIINS